MPCGILLVYTNNYFSVDFLFIFLIKQKLPEQTENTQFIGSYMYKLFALKSGIYISSTFFIIISVIYDHANQVLGWIRL